VFVSHNLHAVSELCARTVLIDRGRLVAEGPTADVIRAYTDRERAKLDSARTGAVLIRSVTLRGADGPTVRFEPGDMMLVDVAFEVSERCAGVDVILAIHGDDLERLLDTSTGRLGAQPVPLESGQTGIATFELYLHLAKGTFHVAASLWRYDTQQVVDSVVPAATFQVCAGSEISGPLHAYPRLAAFGVHDGRAGAENPDR
jgi:Wzt C-terminal domain